MFNLSSDREAQPISAKQAAFLARLITRHGKPSYQEAKRQAGVPEGVTLLRLTRWQASRLIEILKGGER